MTERDAPDSTRADAPSSDEPVSIDQAALDRAAAATITLRAPALTGGLEAPAVPEAIAPVLEDLADDLLHLVKRVGAIEGRLTDMSTRVDELLQIARDQASVNARAVDAMRRDLLADRRTQAVRHAFDAVSPILDGLGAMQAALDPLSDDRLRAQLAAIMASLRSLLQGLGFVEFHAAAGEAFDPARMRVAGYAAGPADVVLASLHPGYLADGTVARPAGVLIADPTAASVRGRSEDA